MNARLKSTKRRRGVSQLVSIGSIVIVLVMLFIALPTIPLRDGWSLATVFGLVWAAFAILIIGAHLHRLLRVNESTEVKLRKIRAERYRSVERRMMGSNSE